MVNSFKAVPYICEILNAFGIRKYAWKRYVFPTDIAKTNRRLWQTFCNSFRPQKKSLRWKILQIKDEIKVREDKPPLVNQQCAVYHFQCSLCDAGYVGYTCRHLHQRIEEHKGSAIGNHLREQHNMAPNDIARSFKILRKCQNKLDCLIFEMLFYQRTETITKQTVRFYPR